MTLFIYGPPASVEDSALLSTPDITRQIGENTGNMAFCYAIGRHLPSARLVPKNSNHPLVRSAENTGVLPLANHLGPHANLGGSAKNLDKVAARLVGIGLGAQAGHNANEVRIPEGTLEWVRKIQERAPTDAPNLGLRGPFTQASLERYGLADKTAVLGCPTLFINPDPQLGATIAKRCTPELGRIAVASGNPGWKPLAKLEQSLAALLGDTGLDYICQSPESMINLGRGLAHLRTIAAEDLEGCRQYIRPDLDTPAFIQWATRHAVSFFSVPAWMEHLLHFDFVIGTRIHGVMLALQAGVPGMCLAHDSRTIELCTIMGVPYVTAQSVQQGITREQIAGLFKFDAQAFDQNRRMLAQRYVAFLQANKLAYAPYLDAIAAGA